MQGKPKFSEKVLVILKTPKDSKNGGFFVLEDDKGGNYCISRDDEERFGGINEGQLYFLEGTISTWEKGGKKNVSRWVSSYYQATSSAPAPAPTASHSTAPPTATRPSSDPRGEEIRKGQALNLGFQAAVAEHGINDASFEKWWHFYADKALAGLINYRPGNNQVPTGEIPF